MNPMARFSSFCSISHHVHTGHYIPCELCKETPFAVIWKLEPEPSVQFADSESEITLKHIQAVKKPQ